MFAQLVPMSEGSVGGIGVVLPPLYEIFWSALILLVILLVVGLYALPRIYSMIDQRRDAIQEGLDNAEKAREDLSLASRKKEPSAPRKIGYGMLVAGIGYIVMVLASVGLSYNLTDAQRVSPMWLVSTYLILTFAELLLSPMGISFVSKVAPQKYQGLMMGCWFGATAIGNFLVQIPAYLWNNISLPAVWGVLVALCVASFVFVFAVMKKLEKVC